MKRSADLDPKRDERQRLKESLQLNASLAPAYYLKEDLAQVWQQAGKVSGRIVLDRWIAAAESSGIQQLMKFARTLQIHREGIHRDLQEVCPSRRKIGHVDRPAIQGSPVDILPTDGDPLIGTGELFLPTKPSYSDARIRS